MRKLLLVALLTILAGAAWSQDTLNRVPALKKDSALYKNMHLKAQGVEAVKAAKTNTSLDILSDFYQLNLNDLSGTGKGLTFGATITAILSGFSPDSTRITTRFEDNFQPELLFGYKNNFNIINTSLGFKWSVINQTDAKHTKLLNANPAVMDQIHLFEASLHPAEVYLNRIANKQDSAFRSEIQRTHGDTSLIRLNTQKIMKQLKSQQAELTKFELTADTSKLSPGVKAILDGKADSAYDPKHVQSLIGRVKLFTAINKKLDSVSRKVANGWNVSVNPLLIYDLTLGGVQGADFGLTASKGFPLFDKAHSSQLLMKINYNIGADTVVTAINTGRRILTDQLGFNQVLASSVLRSVSKTQPTPWLELAVTGSYNYVYAGLKPKEKNAQPALNLKMGILAGKSTWLTLPFTYNFAQKTGMALISMQVNIGSAPISN